MTKTFTSNDIIRYIYEDLPETEKQCIAALISTDKEFNTLYNELQQAQEMLNQLTLAEPSDKTVDKILDFSRNYTACQV
ncbi:hypothetical protein QNI16_30650 [Cytophagaceae bacterium YF14B1]|uniref:Uncharacterized protein n=1 Tax=Xanthocytophaga flava TaxID=3048013 RepID=A0AAE3QY46_9BACT|nr:hypothetical protein [Xanthocytophaga flavus]MDJ1484899.1 hypothetical protein [Xanthocytophaga flavus]